MEDTLEARGNENGGNHSPPTGRSFFYDKGFLPTDLKPPEHVQPVHKRNTVRELLLMRRQTWSPSPDGSSVERGFKRSKSEALSSGAGPHLLEPPAPVNCVQSAPGCSHTPSPPLQGLQVCPTAEVRPTLFHWQITREEQRVGGVPPELLSAQDEDGDTSLHIAVAQGKRALAYVLAAKMARWGSLEMKERNGQTPLHLAAATDQHLIVRDLLSHGARADARDRWGRSPLHVCAEKGQCLRSVWSMATASGQPTDLEVFNYDGLTPLHMAVLSHNAAVKELRTKEHACLNMTMEQVQRKHACAESIKILLLMGASIGTKDLKSGRTCLHMAAEEANVDLFDIFLSQPSPFSVVNAAMFSGNTALHIVSSLRSHQSQLEAVKQLMRHGADPGARNLENKLPSQLVPEGPVGEKVKRILRGKQFHA